MYIYIYIYVYIYIYMYIYIYSSTPEGVPSRNRMSRPYFYCYKTQRLTWREGNQKQL